jgi:hypothetical protein
LVEGVVQTAIAAILIAAFAPVLGELDVAHVILTLILLILP